MRRSRPRWRRTTPSFFESSKDPTRDTALLDRVKELRAELQTVENELAELRTKVVPLPRRLTVERVKAYLEKLRGMVDERPEYQRTLFQEMKRQHAFKVRPVSKEEVVASIALPLREIAAEETLAAVGGSRVFTVISGGGMSGGPKGPGLPEPGGPIIMALWPPAAAITIARSAPSWPRTSVKSTASRAGAQALGSRAVGVGASSLARASTRSRNAETGSTSIPSTTEASRAFWLGTKMLESPASRAATASGSAPRIGLDASVQGELSGEQVPLERPPRRGCPPREHAQGDGQVERGAVLADVGRREVDRDLLHRQLEVAVLDRREDPDLALLHGAVGEPDDGEEGHAHGHVDLHVHHHRVHAHQRARLDRRQHRSRPSLPRASRGRVRLQRVCQQRFTGGRPGAGARASRKGTAVERRNVPRKERATPGR